MQRLVGVPRTAALASGSSLGRGRLQVETGRVPTWHNSFLVRRTGQLVETERDPFCTTRSLSVAMVESCWPSAPTTPGKIPSLMERHSGMQ